MLEVIKRLKDNEHEAFLVGGIVRDMLLDRENKDIDIFTTASLLEVKALFPDAKIIDVLKKRGTILLILNHRHYEISTFRTDVQRIEYDVTLRDFTMNSLLYDGEIHDYVNGKKDIENKLIRVNAKERLIEDPLRILRALRFKSTLGFKIEETTEKYLFETKDLLKMVAPERVYKELKLLLLGENVTSTILKYVDILAVLIPELKQMQNFNQQNPHHQYDLLTHTLKVIEHSPYDPSIRLASLFHDFGKLDTFTVDEKGIGHFYGHHKISVEKSNYYLKKFKADNKTTKEVNDLVYYHNRDIHPTQKALRRLILQIDENIFLKLMELKKADHLGKKDKPNSTKDLDKILKIYKNLKQQEKLLSLKTLNITGKDIIKLGYKEGEIIGEILNDVLNKCVNEDLINEKELLIKYIKEHYRP